MRVKVELANPEHDEDVVTVESALVDTGAFRTTIPRSLANQLRLKIVGRQQVRTADGVHEIDQSYATVKFDGRQTVGDVWISDSYPGVLIGVLTLESLGLAVDPKSGKLIDSPFLLL